MSFSEIKKREQEKADKSVKAVKRLANKKTNLKKSSIISVNYIMLIKIGGTAKKIALCKQAILKKYKQSLHRVFELKKDMI